MLRRLLWAGCLLPLTPAFAQSTTPAASSLGMPPARPAPPPQVLLMRVAQDGSGDYRTIQEAVNAVRDLSQVMVTIQLKPGIYREKLLIPSHKTHIRLVGESAVGTIITGADHTGDAAGHNTYSSQTVLVQANDFTAENITFENAAGPVGQAVALHVDGDRAIFRHCRMLGNQDTLFPAVENSRQYYQDCYIEGTTDFIFGSATAVFDHCEIRSKRNSYIAAAATTERQAYGFVFMDCRLTADTAAHKVFLGRPWRPHSRTVYLRCELGAHILPGGWDNWRDPANEQTAYYAEYQSTGPGANPGARVKWAHQLTAKEAKTYSLSNIFNAPSPWLPAGH
ncbi:pectinesterase family protein [Hymenobacter baengnokdamensis]|uniref:pectinesterase family protein n=1 Tax=Hymenobacter baengnokdamensis TaxID=2615203 RepID=UPI001243D0E5|nr:pectinesterase family protein [Hymenobacter baengnokdamensis]